MICRNCGEDNSSSTRFCKTCGANLVQAYAYEEDEMEQGIPEGENLYVGGSQRVTTAMKKVAGSGSVLFTIFLLIGSVALNVYYSMNYVTQAVSRLLDMVAPGIDSLLETAEAGIAVADIQAAMVEVPAPSLAYVMGTQIFAIGFILCMLMIYISGKRKTISTVGFSIIRFFEILRFIVIIVAYVAMIAGSVFLTVILYLDQDYYGELYLYIGGIALGILIVFVLVCIYNAKMIGTLTAAKMAMHGDPTGNFSSFVAFFLILSAILGLILNVALGVMLLDPFMMGSGVLSGLITLLLGSSIKKARYAVKNA